MRPPRHLPVATAAPDFLVGYDGGDPQTPGPDESADGVVVADERGDDGERLLQVGDLAKASGKTVRAIHHYEEVGLLRPHARSKGRYRLYDQASLDRLQWIGKLHDLGLSLGQIQEMVQLWETASSAPGAMGRIRAVYRQKLDETRAQIARLEALERELAASVEYLDTCVTCDPGEIVRACTCCNHRDPGELEPHLVAGIHLGSTVCAEDREAR